VAKLGTVIVAGASLAGLRAAQALRRRGFDGRLVLVGEERHPPYDRPPLSKDVLAGRWEPERTHLLRAGDADLAAEWRLGTRATGLDVAARRLHLAGGESLAFDGLVIATGAAPRRLRGAPDLAGVFVLRTLDDCLALRAALERGPRVAVVGAGFIGAEVAATCRARGLAVSLVEALPVPLGRSLGEPVGRVLASLHRDHGVDLRCGVGVARLLGGSRVEGLELSDGARIAADVVVVGVGVAPATDWLAGSGLELDDGVACDAACAAAPGVVAAGDVARWWHTLFGERLRVEHWTNAVEQAEAAAARLLDGAGALPYAPVPYFWSDQYDRKIQFAGRAGPDDETALVDGSFEERRFVLLYARAGRLRGVMGWNRPSLVMKYKAMIRTGASLAEARAAAP
jgi:NADPH-dependent 2,4-dienoyl-CoA reductase/sulfur reductase-like enzyme